ncbi:MAG: prepilin-type N-terminal cleavage/methylation domain-containing protein [Candidatus Microsaccharimonas sp.]
MTGWIQQRPRSHQGFSIVELIVVIVIIAILAAVVAVGYGAVVNNAHDSAVKSDLQKIDDAFKQFALDSGGTYPDSYLELGNLDVKVTGGSYDVNTMANMYICLNPSATEYAIIAMSRSLKRFVAKGESGISEYTGTVEWTDVAANWDETCASIDPTYQSFGDIAGMVDGQWLSWTGADGAIAAVSCPTGYIVVPGNTTFGTDDFCVMKYEAKNSSGFTVSEAAGAPWVSISQTSAIATATGACSGCHLITEAEWMTIAANVLSVASNWSGGSVGSGYIYSGHNDNVPANSLAASTDDNDGYSGTGQTTGSNQRRTLTLTNGEVIWDLAGNVYEWTNATIASGQQPGLSGESAFAWKEWNNGSLLMNGLPVNSRPSAISGTVASYSSTQGIGQLYSNYSNTNTRTYLRGGDWGNANYTGVLTLVLSDTPSSAYSTVGFRVAK